MPTSESTPLVPKTKTRHRQPCCSPQARHKASAAIFVAVLFERTVFYSLVGNLTYFLTREPLCWNESAAVSASVIAVGISWTMGLFGGWISDSCLGRYWTIIVAYVVYIAGHSFLPYLTWYTDGNSTTFSQAEMRANEGSVCNQTYLQPQLPPICKHPNSSSVTLCGTWLYACLAVVCTASGVIHSNLPSFGGDQVREYGTEETQRFFRWFYWMINIGGLTASVFIAFLQQFNYFYACIVVYVFLFISFIAFLAGTKWYIRRPVQVSVLTNIFRMIACALRQKYRLRYLTKGQKPASFIDYATVQYDGTFTRFAVDDVKSLWRIIKVFLLLIPFYIAYTQVEGSNYLLQGIHMRVDFKKPSCSENTSYTHNIVRDMCNISNEDDIVIHNPKSTDSNFNIPPATLQSFDTIFIIMILPLVGSLYEKLTRAGIAVSVYRRVLFGHCLLIASLVTAGFIELWRINDIYTCGYYRQLVGNTVIDASPSVSVWWQIPQYSLLGAAEVFVMVTEMEYAFIESPQSMQGVIMGLFWFFSGVGNMIGLALPDLVRQAKSGILDNTQYINCNKLQYYFWILACISFVGAIIFYICARCFNLKLERVIRVLIIDDAPTPNVARRANSMVVGRINRSASRSFSESSNDNYTNDN